MRRALLSFTAALCLMQGAAYAQQPITTNDLTVRADQSAPGVARVVGSNNQAVPTAVNGATPKGVYVAGNPILSYCPSDGPCPTALQDQVHGQVIVAGQTVDPTASEHMVFQHYIVNTGGDARFYRRNERGELVTPGKEGFDTYTVLNPTPDMPVTAFNAPAVWAMNGNLIMNPGARPRFAVGFEQDIGNNTGVDCGQPGLIGDCHLMLLLAQGKNRVTTGIALGGGGRVNYGLDIGERGTDFLESEGAAWDPVFASKADIRIRDSAPVGILFQRDGGNVSHSTATIEDHSVNTPTTLQTFGNRSVATLNLRDTAPVGLRLEGNHGVGVSTVQDSTGTAINMRPGQAVCWTGDNCVIWTPGDGFRFTVTKNGAFQNVARIDNNGDLWLRGRVFQYAPTGGGL